MSIALLLVLSLPIPAYTPGEIDGSHRLAVLCAGGNAGYPRHVTDATRALVAGQYGVARADWGLHEFDHLIPHCAGGSDGPRNIWPEPLAEAKVKDAVEVRLCRALCAGTRGQSEVADFFRRNAWASAGARQK